MRWNKSALWLGVAICVGGCQQDLPEAGPVRQEFYNVYSRPNDDTFQNAAGNAGVPYEVARVRTAIIVDHSLEKAKLKMTWQATMVTGRHVEAGQYFVLERLSSNLSEVPVSNLSEMAIIYPIGKHRDSSSEEKKGSVIQTEIALGEARHPGRYEGDLVLKIQAPKLEQGDTKHFVDGGPKAGIFKRIHWSLRYDGSKVSDVELTYRRAKEPQVKLIESNFTSIDYSNQIHHPYPEQPRAAVCRQEKVGDGDQDTESGNIHARFQKGFGRRIVEAGCLSCHGEGVGDNQLFCDDGKALTPSTTYSSMIGFLEDSFDWEMKNPDGRRRYRTSMESCFKDLKKAMSDVEYQALKELYGNHR